MARAAARERVRKEAGYEVSVYRLELVRTHSVLSRYRHVETPAQVAHVFRLLVGESDREHFVAFFLDTQHQVIGVQIAAVGAVNMVHCPPSAVFKGALLGNAVAVVLAHNHPHGPPTPSTADVELTHQMELAGAVLGVVVLDHVVIGRRGSVSLRQTDRMLMPESPSEFTDDDLDARLWGMRGWSGTPSGIATSASPPDKT